MDISAEARSRAKLYTPVVPTETVLTLLFGIATLLVMAFHLVVLTTYPPVFIDEAWTANAAWNWLKTGVNFDSIHAGTLDQFGYEWVRWPYIGHIPWLISFALLDLGLFQARLVSWVFGALLLVVLMAVGRWSYTALTGALAALLLGLSPPFLQASHYARQDIMLAALLMATYLIALSALKNDKGWAHFLAGLFLGLSLDIHQNGLLFAPGLGVMYLMAYRTKVLHKRGPWLCAVGGLLGIAYYMAGHVLPNPNAYAQVFNYAFAGSHELPIQTLNPMTLLASALREIGRYHFYDNGLDFALIGASTVYLAVRRSAADRFLLAFMGSAFVCFVLFVGNKHDIYAILFYPFFMLMVAEALVSLIRSRIGFDRQRVFVMALLGLFLVNSVQHFARPVVRNRNYNYDAIVNQIRSVIPEGVRIVGLPHWWLGLADYDYRSTLNLTFYRLYNGYGLTEGLEVMRPDILIVDSGLEGLLVDEGSFPPGPGFEIYKLPRREFEDFLRQRGELLLQFSDPWHGQFRIFAIQWD